MTAKRWEKNERLRRRNQGGFGKEVTGKALARGA